MENPNTINTSIYDVTTLVQWYIDLRKYKSDLKLSIEPAIAHTERQMEQIERELHNRMVQNGTKSMKTDKGTIARVKKTKYLLTDSFAFRQWLAKNPEVGSQLVSGITQGEVKAYLEDGNELPDGLTTDEFFDISVRRA